MPLRYVGHISTNDDLLDVNLQALDVVTMASGTYLYAATGQGGGVTSWRLENGLATEVDRTYFPGWVGGAAGGVANGVEVGGSMQVVIGGGATQGQGTLLGYQLGAQGQINALAQTGSLAAGTWQVSDVVSCGTSANILYVADTATGQLAAYRPNSAGDYAPAGGVSVFDLGGVAEMETVRVGNQNLLLAASHGENGLFSYTIGAGGQLTEAGFAGAVSGLGVATPTALEVVTAFGQTWVVLAAAGSSSLSVMRLDASGGLTPVEHVIDGLATRFAGAQTLAVTQSGDHVFVVAGGSDDGLSLFTLLPDGRLLHLQSIAHEIGLGLMNVAEISASVQGNEIQLFVTSGVDAGISQFSIPLDNLGVVRRDTGNGSTTLTGTAGNDILEAGQTGQDTLRGFEGDDILLAGDGGANLWGGAGADHFVISQGSVGQVVRVLDFQVGQDVLDLSDFGMLRNPGQLSIQSTGFGARLSFRDTEIEVHNAAGGPLTLSALFGSGFSWPDRVILLPPPPGELIEGTGGADVLTGTSRDDTIVGQGGNDRLTGGSGADEIWAGTGNDTLRGGAENDTLGAGVGNDWLYGEGGDDELWGAAGDDRAWGGNGDDMLGGGDGRDTLFGEGGDDIVWGGNHGDLLYGGDGNDTVGGFSGDDEMWGGAGADQIWGNIGNDTAWGGTGDDTIGGFDGNDWIYGEDGDDDLRGGAGNDVINGADGDDTIDGGSGADNVWAGAGNDVIRGGEGDDTLGGAGGNDTIYGEGGNDQVWGAEGDDRGWGGWGNDTVGGGDGNDTMYGGAGRDIVWGGNDEDRLYGGDGDDTVGGFSGDDFLYGEAGNDFVWGNVGNDLLHGGGGNDMLGGFDGEDTLYGADGRDTLSGGRDSDALWGGAGADTFVFVGSHGSDRVLDFEDGLDLLHVQSSGYTSFGQITIIQAGADAILQLAQGSIVIENTAASALTASDFLFG